MTSKIKYQRNYTKFKETYQSVLPSLEDLIPEDESVRLLSRVLEELDYTKLYQAYSAKGRNPVVDPKTMFKILIYAYSQGIYSSRKIERACLRDIHFLWLLAGQKAPDHSTIARFRTRFLVYTCEDLFYQMVRYLSELDELSKETIFIDGTKLEACANRYTFVWKKSVNHWEEKMFPKIEQAVFLLNQDYLKSFTVTKETRTRDLQRIMDFLEQYVLEHSIVFVSGRGHRKTVHQRFYEMFRRFLDRQLLYDLHHSRFQDRNSYSKTDIDATFMHMKDDHMRNAQLKPGYNVQIAVDSEYIVATDVFSDRTDALTLIPFLKRIRENLAYHYPSITADAGYESEEIYEYLKKSNQTPYIKPQTCEKWKKRSFKKDISKRENMEYDEKTDTYICHNQKRLLPIYHAKKKSKSGYESEQTVYECESCEGCHYKKKCTRAKGNKKLKVSKKFILRRQESYENIQSRLGKKYRMNRSIQVEGAFGVLKSNYAFQRFLLRGKTKVKLEILLLCFGYNINKLHRKTQKCRLRSYFFELQEG